MQNLQTTHRSHSVLRFLRTKLGLVVLACFLLLSIATIGFAASTLQLAPAHAAMSTSKLTLSFTCASATDHKSGHVCVHTAAGAALTIKVRYCSGAYATSKSLKGTVHANSKGNYTWSWTPDTKCKGQATATVTDKWKGQSVTGSRKFVVK